MTRSFALTILKETLFKPLTFNFEYQSKKDNFEVFSKLLYYSVMSWNAAWSFSKQILSNNPETREIKQKVYEKAIETFNNAINDEQLQAQYDYYASCVDNTYVYNAKGQLVVKNLTYTLEETIENFFSSYNEWKIELREAISTFTSDEDFDGDKWDSSPKEEENRILSAIMNVGDMVSKLLTTAEERHQNDNHPSPNSNHYELFIKKLSHYRNGILVFPCPEKPSHFCFTKEGTYESVMAAIKGTISLQDLYKTGLIVTVDGTPYKSFKSFEESLRGRSKRKK